MVAHLRQSIARVGRQLGWVWTVATAVAFLLGAVGLALDADRWGRFGLGGCLYGAAQLFVLNGQAEWFASASLATALLGVAALGAPLVLAFLFAAVVDELASELGGPRYRGAGKHVVVLGCGRVGLEWVKYFRSTDPPRDVVIVDTADRDPSVGRAIDLGAVLVSGSVFSPKAQERAKLREAGVVVLATGDDLTNLRVAREVADVSIPVVVYCRLGTRELKQHVARSGIEKLVPFNPFEWAATRAVRPFDGAGDKSVHVVICGFGRFGQAVRTRILKLAEDRTGQLAGLHVIDREATKRIDSLGLRAEDKLDITSADAELLSARSRNLVKLVLQGAHGDRVAVYVCTDRDLENLVFADFLAAEVPGVGEADVTVFTRQSPPQPWKSHERVKYINVDSEFQEEIKTLVKLDVTGGLSASNEHRAKSTTRSATP